MEKDKAPHQCPICRIQKETPPSAVGRQAGGAMGIYGTVESDRDGLLVVTSSALWESPELVINRYRVNGITGRLTETPCRAEYIIGPNVWRVSYPTIATIATEAQPESTTVEPIPAPKTRLEKRYLFGQWEVYRKRTGWGRA